MERLTKRTYVDKKFDGYCFDGIDTVKDYKEAYESGYLTIVLSRAEEKLGQFEDFMEEQGFESLEDLKIKLGKSFYVYDDDARQGKVYNGVFFSNEQLMVMDAWNEFNNDYFKKYLDKQRENQVLKDRWEKLKEIIEKDMEHNLKEYDESFCVAFQHYSACENWVLDKMEELEKGGK